MPKLWTPEAVEPVEKPAFLRLVQEGNAVCLVIAEADGTSQGGHYIATIQRDGTLCLHGFVDRKLARRAGIKLTGDDKIEVTDKFVP